MYQGTKQPPAVRNKNVILLASTVRDSFKYNLSDITFDVTEEIPKDPTVFEWFIWVIFQLCSAPTCFVNVCETCITAQTKKLTCFDTQQSLLIPCQQPQRFLFVFYQTALSLFLSLHGSRLLISRSPSSLCLWLCHVRHVLGFRQFPKTTTPACAVLHHCRGSIPDLEKKIHYGCWPLRRNPFRIPRSHVAVLAQLVCNHVGLTDG